MNEVAKQLWARYPAPLNMLVVSLYTRNKDYWLKPPMQDTIGADRVREYGLTENQELYADAIAEMMTDTHPDFESMEMPARIEDEEILSDTTAEEVIDDLE